MLWARGRTVGRLGFWRERKVHSSWRVPLTAMEFLTCVLFSLCRFSLSPGFQVGQMKISRGSALQGSKPPLCQPHLAPQVAPALTQRLAPTLAFALVWAPCGDTSTSCSPSRGSTSGLRRPSGGSASCIKLPTRPLAAASQIHARPRLVAFRTCAPSFTICPARPFAAAARLVLDLALRAFRAHMLPRHTPQAPTPRVLQWWSFQPH